MASPPEQVQQPASTSSEVFRQKWQLRLLPFMQVALVLAGLYFVIVGERRFTEFEGALVPASSPTDSLTGRITQLGEAAAKAGSFEFATRAALEVETLRLRYVEANTLILSRAWTRYMGFITGVILSLVGAVFVLAQFREPGTKVSTSGGGWAANLESASPGLVLVFCGSVLIGIVLLVGLDVNVRDSAVYLTSPAGVDTMQRPALPFNPAAMLQSQHPKVDDKRDSLKGAGKRDSVK